MLSFSSHSLLSVLVLWHAAIGAEIPSYPIVGATECKTCPYSLCPNKPWEERTNLTCWTQGTKIVDDTTWLRTTEGCYVTQWDMVEYPGDCSAAFLLHTEDLPYCGYIEEEWTDVPARTKHMSDCLYAPSYSQHFIKQFKPEVDLTLTCVTKDGKEELKSRKWYKTRANCYVHEATLYRVRDESDLDDCGPIYTNLDPRDHLPDPEPEPPVEPTAEPTLSSISTMTSPVPIPTSFVAAASLQEVRIRKPRHRFAPRRMYNTTAGEEYVNCTEKYSNDPNSVGKVKRVYEFGQRIVVQCGEPVSNGEGQKATRFTYTTDNCWVRDLDTDPAYEGGYIQWFMQCAVYTDTTDYVEGLGPPVD